MRTDNFTRGGGGLGHVAMVDWGGFLEGVVTGDWAHAAFNGDGEEED